MKDLSVNDRVILRKGRNSNSHLEGQILVISALQGSGNYRCKTPTGGEIAIYSTHPADDFCLADRKDVRVHIERLVEKKEEELNELRKELKEIGKFNSDEEAVADKLWRIKKADSPDEIAEILKELKQSHYL